MSSSENHFRTVAFGGFHKQDVLEYITALSREDQERSEDLTRQAQSARKERDELAEKLESAEEERKKNAAECERLSAALEQRSAEGERAEKELAALKAEQEQTRARLAELEEKVPRLEADAASYAALKDSTATIELEAHRKAQETVEQARQQAAQIRAEMESWLRWVQRTYQRLRADVSATVTHLAEELERSRKALEEAEPAFRQHDEALAALLERERTAAGPKAPEPLPLDEREGEEKTEESVEGIEDV